MGFKPERKLYRLRFADGSLLDGLVVEATSASMDTILSIQEMSESLQGEKMSVKAAAEVTRKMVEMFVNALKNWDLLDDEDQPVPCTLEGALSQDPDIIMTIISAWTDAVSGVSAPLEGGSPSGVTFPEGSIPMEPLSLSQVS